ncbi:MAG: LPS export ABC transporter periplasmic protein LptC [Campylobacteraceae bacterium]|nr:LPS export ABC transporter periplasmic protein LptC [Campylobacteraceae bacterium]
MAVTSLKYFLLIFAIIMVFLLTKNPYEISYSPKGKNQADIILFGVKTFEITKSGVNSILVSSKVERFKGYDKLYNINALHKGILNLIDSVVSDKGLLVKNILYLDDNVKYTRSDDLVLNSNSIKYDLNNKILSSNRKFEFIKKNTKTIGTSFVYQMQKGIINAKNIKSIIRINN